MNTTTLLQPIHNVPDTDSLHDANLWNNVRKSGTHDLGYSYAKFFDSLYNYWARITADARLTTDTLNVVVVRYYLDPMEYKLNIHNEQ